MRFLLCVLVAAALHAQPRKLLVVSVDGLDQRYLDGADKLGLKIPNLRRMMREGMWSHGVIGVYPTVTWPSHTTMISGATPEEHGILSNRRPKSEGGDYYWSTSLLKVRTLVDAAREQGRKTAAITWPVTVDAPIDFNLPEYFVRRNGGGMDLRSIESKGTAGLVEEIAARYPSFAQEWMDDRTRTLATLFFMREKRPDLILVHLVDHDAAAHDNGPFSREANALVEYTDELLGSMMAAAGTDYTIAIVSDHGFERTDTTVNLSLALKLDDITVQPFLLVAHTPDAEMRIDAVAADGKLGIGRKIPRGEFERYAPKALARAAAAWEPREHFSFRNDSGELHGKPHERGNHGLWPGRENYRSVFLLWGAGVKPERLPELQMTSLAERFAGVIGLKFRTQERRSAAGRN